MRVSNFLTSLKEQRERSDITRIILHREDNGSLLGSIFLGNDNTVILLDYNDTLTVSYNVSKVTTVDELINELEKVSKDCNITIDSLYGMEVSSIFVKDNTMYILGNYDV